MQFQNNRNLLVLLFVILTPCSSIAEETSAQDDQMLQQEEKEYGREDILQTKEVFQKTQDSIENALTPDKRTKKRTGTNQPSQQSGESRFVPVEAQDTDSKVFDPSRRKHPLSLGPIREESNSDGSRPRGPGSSQSSVRSTSTSTGVALRSVEHSETQSSTSNRSQTKPSPASSHKPTRPPSPLTPPREAFVGRSDQNQRPSGNPWGPSSSSPFSQRSSNRSNDNEENDSEYSSENGVDNAEKHTGAGYKKNENKKKPKKVGSQKESSSDHSKETKDSKTKDSKTKDSKTKDSKTKDSKTKDSKTKDLKEAQEKLKEKAKEAAEKFVEKIEEKTKEFVTWFDRVILNKLKKNDLDPELRGYIGIKKSHWKCVNFLFYDMPNKEILAANGCANTLEEQRKEISKEIDNQIQELARKNETHPQIDLAEAIDRYAKVRCNSPDDENGQSGLEPAKKDRFGKFNNLIRDLAMKHRLSSEELAALSVADSLFELYIQSAEKNTGLLRDIKNVSGRLKGSALEAMQTELEDQIQLIKKKSSTHVLFGRLNRYREQNTADPYVSCHTAVYRQIDRNIKDAAERAEEKTAPEYPSTQQKKSSEGNSPTSPRQYKGPKASEGAQ